MAASTPTRRSQRTLEKFCNGHTFKSYTREQTCLVISLCHISGWSADHIALHLQSLKLDRPLAEELWDFHWQWITSREGIAKTTVQEDSIMAMMLSEANVSLPEMGLPLNRTPKPTTVSFKDEFCCLQHDNGSALVANWTAKARNESKSFLRANTSANAASKPTPAEANAFDAFGIPLANIMRNVLKRWHKAMSRAVALQDMEDKYALKPIRQTEQVHLIMSYLHTYQRLFDSTFGLMEEQSHPSSGEENHCAVRIRSTGFAAKVFLGIIMADRLAAMIQRRKELRQSAGFLPVETKDLSKDDKNCPICCDELGVPNPEGFQEEAVRVVICCNQVFGENCLKLWLKENWKTFDRDSCPNCRFKFPQTFLQKLLKDDQAKPETKAENNDEASGSDGSQSDEVEEAASEHSSGEESTDTSSSSATQTPIPTIEEDTPMGNTQVEIVEVAEEPLPSTEHGDDFMMEG